MAGLRPHIGPGLVYLLLAPLQLRRGLRERNLARHRAIGRIALIAGAVSGVFAIIFGLLHSFGGTPQASAAALFGAYFLLALATAYRAVHRRDYATHRRWMIRAFAVALAVGTIRIWIGLFQGLGLLGERLSFGVAFWLALAMHVVAAEVWLRRRPGTDGPRPAAVA